MTERDRLGACEERDGAERDHDDLVLDGGRSKCEHEREREPGEHRVERVLGHQRAGDERRQTDGQRGREQRRHLAYDTPCEEIGG